MAVSNEKAKSVILTTNRDFRAKAVSMLNNLAFAAEKLAASSVDEIRVQLNRDKTLVNVIVDATVMSDPEFGHLAEKWDDIMKGRDARALIYYAEAQKGLIEKHKAKIDSWAHSSVVVLPQDKPQYVACFYSARKQGSSAFPGAQTVTTNDKAPAPTPAAAPAAAAPNKDQASANKNSTNFFEASQHVRDTIDSLNNIIKDRTAMKALVHVGQRFNGIIGAFAFFGNKDGYIELVKLADFIDTVARSYQNPGDRKEATEAHVTFILDAAKCAYIILKEMRESGKPSAGSKDTFGQIAMQFDLISDVKKKEKNGQDDIDKLLEAEQSKLAS